MAWLFEGVGQSTGIRVTAAGTIHIFGSGTQRCSPASGDFDVIDLVRNIEGAWSINSSDAGEIDYDGAGMGLKNFHQESHSRISGMINFYHPRRGYPVMPAMVAASIIVPASEMTTFFELAKLLLIEPKLRFQLALDFTGLRVEGAESPNPSYAEFSAGDLLSKRAYFSNEISFSVLPPKEAETSIR
jgi:hypothetical protein